MLKIAREIFTTGTLSGQIIVSYKALKVKENKTKAMLLISAASYTLDGLRASYGNDSAVNWQLTNCRLENISANWTEIWQTEVKIMSAISSLANSARLMALQPHFPPSAVHFATNKHFLPFVNCIWTSHDTPTCYLLSHCQFEHSVYLGTSSVAKRRLHNYQQLHCDYSATVMTVSVLELVQLADLFRFIVMLS